MAIYNGRILMRKGNEADFDAEKLMSGEWAVSLDKGIVRICLEAGKVIRMATYEAFEEDMKQIEAILLECQTIEEAVQRINAEVSEKLNACAEYVQQAKNYSEQAKTSEANAKSYMQSAKTSEENAKESETNAKASENSAKESENNAKLTEERAREVFESIPEDYSTISNDLYELAIKETASGEEIHLNDSANLKFREFALYGKAKQNTTSGNQLLNYEKYIVNGNGLITTVNEDKSVTIKGTPTKTYASVLNMTNFSLEVGTYYVSGGEIANGSLYLQVQKVMANGSIQRFNNRSFNIDGTEQSVMVNIQTNEYLGAIDYTIYPMVNKGATALPFEPYTNGASPNPYYPQEIEVSGESGSVEVKSCGKNSLNYEEWKTVNSVRATTVFENNGVKITATDNDAWTYFQPNYFPEKARIPVLEGENIILSWETDKTKNGMIYVFGNGDTAFSKSVNAKNTNSLAYTVPSGVTFITFRFGVTNSGETISYKNIMVRKEIDTDDTYEPYREPKTATIPTPNGLAGIKVDSGGNYTDSNGQQWICDEVVKYADGSGEEIQRIGKYVFDGSEDEGWVETIGNVTRFWTTKLANTISKPNVASVKANVLSNQFITKSANNTYLGTEGISVEINGNLSVYAKNITTLDEWKTHLSQNPMTVYYELATPITTPLTAEELAEIEKLHTFYPITNISNDADCGISVTYYCDSKNYIDNKIALLTTAMVNSI